MSNGDQKRQRKTATRLRRTSATVPKHASRATVVTEPTDADAREHYRREKARRVGRSRPPDHPLEQARRAYHALLAADAERAKGGRPRKGVVVGKAKPVRSAASDDED